MDFAVGDGAVRISGRPFPNNNGDLSSASRGTGAGWPRTPGASASSY
ncbi:MAG: hypothetical protein ACR2K0_04020 [Acidimicrobiales bacterium]